MKTAAQLTQSASTPVGGSQRVGPWKGTHIWETYDYKPSVTMNNNLLITGLYRSVLVISACNLCFTICSHIMFSSRSVKMRQSPTIKAGIRLNEINTCPHNTLVKLGYLKNIRSDLPVESKVTDCLTYIKCLCVCVCVCFWLTQWKRC